MSDNYSAAHKAHRKRYQQRPEQREKNKARLKARRLMIKAGKAKRHDGKDIDHKNGNATDNRPSNLRIMDRSRNRSRNNNK